MPGKEVIMIGVRTAVGRLNWMVKRHPRTRYSNQKRIVELLKSLGRLKYKGPPSSLRYARSLMRPTPLKIVYEGDES